MRQKMKQTLQTERPIRHTTINATASHTTHSTNLGDGVGVPCPLRLVCLLPEQKFLIKFELEKTAEQGVHNENLRKKRP